MDRPFESYVSIIPSKLDEYQYVKVPRMILHFALPTIALNNGSLRDLADEPRLEILEAAERISVVTLIASADVLLARLHARARANRKLILISFSKYLSVRRRLTDLKRMYAEPICVVRTYERWFQYVQALPNLQNACLVTAEDGYEVFDSSRWPEIRDAYFPATNYDE